MPDPKFSEPTWGPYRLFFFGGVPGRPEAIFMLAFRTPHERDRAAKERRLEDGQTGIAVTVDYMIAGGDGPKRR